MKNVLLKKYSSVIAGILFILYSLLSAWFILRNIIVYKNPVDSAYIVLSAQTILILLTGIVLSAQNSIKLPRFIRIIPFVSISLIAAKYFFGPMSSLFNVFRYPVLNVFVLLSFLGKILYLGCHAFLALLAFTAYKNLPCELKKVWYVPCAAYFITSRIIDVYCSFTIFPFYSFIASDMILDLIYCAALAFAGLAFANDIPDAA